MGGLVAFMLGTLLAQAGPDDPESPLANQRDSQAAQPKSVVSEPKDIGSIPSPLSDSSDQLQFRIGVPIWTLDLSGDVGVKGVVGHVDVPFHTLFDHLDALVPLDLSLRYGKWGFQLDGQYTKLSENFNARGILFQSGTIEMEQAYADFTVSYRVVDTDPFTVDAFAGGRFNYVSLHGTLQSAKPLLVGNFDESGDEAWIDPILGTQAKVQVLKPMAFVFRGDVGGFGAASHLTYELFGGTEIQIARHFYTDVGYHYLHTDYTSGGFTYNTNMSGPQIEFGINF